MDQGDRRSSIKRQGPTLDRLESAKKPKTTGAAAKAPVLFDLANAMSSISDSARIRQIDAMSKIKQQLDSLMALFKTAEEIEVIDTVPVEIEARVGYLVDKGSFNSGITENEFRLIEKIFSSETCLLPQPDHFETDYIYDTHDEGNLRITVEGDNVDRMLISAVKSKKIEKIFSNFRSDLHYALKVSVATEVEEILPETLPQNWTSYRKKYRSKWRNTGGTPNIPWFIDLTRVETFRPARIDNLRVDPPSVTYELELEMPRTINDGVTDLKTKVLSFNDAISLMMEALSYAHRGSSGPLKFIAPSVQMSSSNIQQINQQNANNNQRQFNQINQINQNASLSSSTSSSQSQLIPNDPNRHPDFPQLHFEKVYSSQHLKSSFDRIFKGHVQFDSSNRFIGTMPINFSRKSIKSIMTKPYFVSEKTDGVRFMLFITNSSGLNSSSSSTSNSDNSNPNAYLIDRSNTYYRIPAFSVPCCLDKTTNQKMSLAQMFTKNGDTLLDGEMVKRHRSDKFYFLIFDIMALNGESVWNLQFADRLAKLGEATSLFNQFVASMSLAETNQTNHLPFTILSKEIMRKDHFDHIYKKITLDQFDKTNTVYGSENSSHFHLTDGLIFMPGDCIYPLYTCQDMFKWKFVDRQTIDFEIVFPKYPANAPNTIEMYIGGNAGTTVLCKTVTISQSDYQRLQADISRNTRKNLVIAEMGFDHKSGQWTYHKLRPDKDKPNYISIAMDTMESIAENVTLKEIAFLLHPK